MERSEDQATAYARDVVDGNQIAGPFVRLACKRHLDDLDRGGERGLSFDVDSSQRAIRFFREILTVEVEERDADGNVEGRVVPFILQPWQAFIIGSLFGWKNAHGYRRFRRAFVEVAKGNGKSPMAAGIGHYMLAACSKKSPEVYSAASALDQAEILFRDAVAMWQRSPKLFKRITNSGEKKVRSLLLIDPKTGRPCGFFRPISAEKKGKSGPRPYCALIDEVHEHPDDTVIEIIRAGTKGSQEALIFEITNSGFDKRTTCGVEHDYSVQILRGELVNDAWFTYIAALDEGDEPFEDEACWIKANPNLGVSIFAPYIREQVQEARGLPSKEGNVRRLNFCQWTDAETAAIPMKIWEACQGEVDVDDLTERGVPCYGGLDLSRTRDLTAFTLTWVLDQTQDAWRFASKTWFWTPGDTMADRARSDRAPYDLWSSQGFLEAVPGPRIRYNWLAEALRSLYAKYQPIKIAADKYGLEQLLDAIDDPGAIPFVVHPQGFNTFKIGDRAENVAQAETGAEAVALWMPDSINKLEAALLEKRITIDPSPVMTMCASGVVYVQNRTGHRMFDKEKSTRRIDGMVALAMSIGIATLHKDDMDSFLSNPIVV